MYYMYVCMYVCMHIHMAWVYNFQKFKPTIYLELVLSAYLHNVVIS